MNLKFLNLHKFLILFLFCILFSNSIQAQVAEAAISTELANRGIPEDSLKLRLISKGIDPDNIDANNFQQFQSIVEETILEYEAAVQLRKSIEQTKEEVDPPLLVENIEPQPNKKETKKTSTEPTVAELSDEIYGHQLFNESGLSAKQSSSDVKPPDSYILGSGDKILINIFGSSSYSSLFEIKKEGYILNNQGNRLGSGSEMKRLYLKGMTLADAKKAAQIHFRQNFLFNSNQFELSLSESRTVNVQIYGEVNEIGDISIPSTNTVVNALSFAGGIKPIGSVRKIKFLSSAGEQVIDFYELLNDPSKLNSLFIGQNDIIQVPVAKKVVRITGAINRPMRYELLDNEQLHRLIDFAGGLAANAYLSDVEIVRFDGTQKVVANVNLNDIVQGRLDYDLRNGDEIYIKQIDSKIQSSVFIEGAVQKPGQYQRTISTRISSLIGLGVLKETARKDFAYLLRFKPDSTYGYQPIDLNLMLRNPGSNDDLILNNMDRLVIVDQAEYADSYRFSIIGAVRNPNEFDFNPSGELKIYDAMLLSGGLLPSSSDIGFIIRQDAKEPKKTTYKPFNPNIVFSNPLDSSNISIQPNDVIRILNKDDYRDEFFVTVSGAVRSPGRFEYDPNMDLKELLQMANGLKFSASTNKIDISRVVIEENEPTKIISFVAEVDRDLSNVMGSKSYGRLMPFDQIYVREIPGFELHRGIYIKGEVNYPGPYSLEGDNERLSSVIERAGGLTKEAYSDGAGLFRSQNNTGFVVTQLNKALDNHNSTWDLIMQEGDTLYIPKQEDIVHIEGAINANELYKEEYLDGNLTVAVGYEGRKNALYYVNEYGGGVNINGSKGKITVQQPNGKIEKTKTFLFFRSYPKVQKGARIIVGNKPIKKGRGDENIDKDPVEWDKVLSNIVAQASAVLTLILLIDRAK